uniref:Uncharacterized protein n=1 Tax=viral metagenome TaxID=1070528 RepID=A0A6C0AKN0_9ZZZZ
MADGGMKISKVGYDAPKTPRTMRTYPRGIRKTARKIEPVRDPAKSPPFKPGTLRILTRKGETLKRKKVQGTLKNLSDRQIHEKLRKSNLSVSEKAPRELLMSILEGGTEAGMIS